MKELAVEAPELSQKRIEEECAPLATERERSAKDYISNLAQLVNDIDKSDKSCCEHLISFMEGAAELYFTYKKEVNEASSIFQTGQSELKNSFLQSKENKMQQIRSAIEQILESRDSESMQQLQSKAQTLISSIQEGESQQTSFNR